MNSKIFFLGAIMLLPTFASCQQEKPFPDDAVDKVYEYLPEWQAGYLDIHQISTGRGNAAYLIFPDGTTMLLDAGDLGVHSGTQEIMKAVPNDSKQYCRMDCSIYKTFLIAIKK
ncbi:hypothetical protein NXX52_13340 [Bacteroides ovatus]|nr:hypothetical protein [Bacteroides ovatus]